MTSKTTNTSSPEVRVRAVRMLLDHEGEHPSRWAAIMSISAKIGCTAQTLNEWVKKAEFDSATPNDRRLVWETVLLARSDPTLNTLTTVTFDHGDCRGLQLG